MFGFFQAPAGFDFPLVAALTAFIALPVKFLVDVVKGAWASAPSNALPIVGIVIGYVFCWVVLVASQTPFNAAVYAQMGIAAVAAQIAAAAATWNQTRADQVDEKIDMALSMPKTSTRADVDEAVKNDNGG